MSIISEQERGIVPEAVVAVGKRPFRQTLIRYAVEAYQSWKMIEPILFFGAHYYRQPLTEQKSANSEKNCT